MYPADVVAPRPIGQLLWVGRERADVVDVGGVCVETNAVVPEAEVGDLEGNPDNLDSMSFVMRVKSEDCCTNLCKRFAPIALSPGNIHGNCPFALISSYLCSHTDMQSLKNS
jgi:fructose/tagatose bisphosphate aldolase